MDSIQETCQHSSYIYDVLIEANQRNDSLSRQREILAKVTNLHALQAGRQYPYYCLNRIIEEEVLLHPSTLLIMLATDTLLWNFLPCIIPQKNLIDESAIHSVLYQVGKQELPLRTKIGSALLYYCPFDGKFILRSPLTLMPDIKRFVKTTRLHYVEDREIFRFVDHYRERMGTGDCFIVNFDFYVDNEQKIKPVTLTSKEIVERNQEIIKYVEAALNESTTVEDCVIIRRWLENREEQDYYVPGVPSTITALKRRIQDRIAYLEKSQYEANEQEKRKSEQIILDGLLQRLREAKTRLEVLKLKEDAKRELSIAKGTLYREQLMSVITRIENKLSNFEQFELQLTQLPYLDHKAINIDKDLESVLKVFYEMAWRRIQTREYGIPDNCRIAVTPNVLKDFSHVLLNEKASKFLCKVFTSDGSSFELDLYSKQPTISLVLLLVFVVANIADIVKGREITPDLTVDSHNRRNIRLAEPSSPGKRDTHQTERKYPAQHLYLGVPTGEGTPHSVRTNCQVVWHFRNIGQKKYSQKALANALKFTGVAHIPKGFTFVRPHPRNAEFGDDFEPVVVETELAASLSKTLDLYFKKL